VSISHAGADFSQQSAFSDEQIASPRSRHFATTENVQHPRDVLPSPPVSPQPSPYSQQLMRTTVNGSPSSSLPSVGKSHVAATEVPAATTRSYGLYEEPRYPTSRSSENPNVSTSSAMKVNPTEVCMPISLFFPTFVSFRLYSVRGCYVSGIVVLKRIAPYPFVPAHHRANTRTPFLQGPHKLVDRFSAMGIPQSSNQVSFSHCNSVVPQEHHGICEMRFPRC